MPHETPSATTQTERIEPLFEAAALSASVADLARKLTADFAPPGDAPETDTEPLLLAILGGSLIFLADLVRAVDRPVRYELIQVGYSEGDRVETPPDAPETLEIPETVQNIHYPIPVEISGRSVVVLKDVVASGVIELYLAEKLRQHGAREVRFAALIDMPDERKTDFALDYSAFTTRRNGILVGYGLKHEGRYGNLPYIGRLPQA
jgi:hypoxanthine phosphoribosyltransferase